MDSTMVSSPLSPFIQMVSSGKNILEVIFEMMLRVQDREMSWNIGTRCTNLSFNARANSSFNSVCKPLNIVREFVSRKRLYDTHTHTHT